MSKHILLTTRILITMLIAGLASGAAALLVTFVMAGLGASNEFSMEVGNAMLYIIFGLATGYRLNDLMKQHREA